MIGATAAAFGGSALAQRLVPVLEQVSWIGAERAEGFALIAVVALVSYLSLVLGELVPKSLGLRAGESYALVAARPLALISWAARPLVWFLTASSNVVLRPFGDRTSFTEARLSKEEIQQLVEEATKAGTFDAQTGEIAYRAIGFGELTTRDVMVPANSMIAVPKDISEAKLKDVQLASRHQRLPVYEGTPDKMVGYVTAEDLLAAAWEDRPILVDRMLRPPLFVPESMPLVKLVHTFQQNRTKLAIVIDEFGGVSGMVTLEDLFEELVGDILGESEARPESVKKEGATALVRGETSIREVNRTLDLDLEESDGWRTIAGYCLGLAGHMPVQGEKLTAPDGTAIEIVEASPRRVRMVRIAPAAKSPA